MKSNKRTLTGDKRTPQRSGGFAAKLVSEKEGAPTQNLREFVAEAIGY